MTIEDFETAKNSTQGPNFNDEILFTGDANSQSSESTSLENDYINRVSRSDSTAG